MHKMFLVPHWWSEVGIRMALSLHLDLFMYHSFGSCSFMTKCLQIAFKLCRSVDSGIFHCWCFFLIQLIETEWHICVSKLTIIGSDNGSSPGRRQAIIWTNAGILLIQTLGTNFSEIWSAIHTFSFKKMLLKMASAKWRLFRLGLNELNSWQILESYMVPLHSSNVTWMSWHLKSLATQLFVQQLFQLNNKGNLKALHYWPFEWWIHQWLVDSPHKGPVMQKALPYQHAIILLLWINLVFLFLFQVNEASHARPKLRFAFCKYIFLFLSICFKVYEINFQNTSQVTIMTCKNEEFNSSPPGQNGRYFADNIFKCIFTN